jgi:hypothetical protein
MLTLLLLVDLEWRTRAAAACMMRMHEQTNGNGNGEKERGNETQKNARELLLVPRLLLETNQPPPSSPITARTPQRPDVCVGD